MGYFNDPFIHFFIGKGGTKDIIMHRGYWARTISIRKIIWNFLEKFRFQNNTANGQILSLGAGLDTTFFCLSKHFRENQQTFDFKYVEADLEEVVKEKISLISKNQTLSQLIGNIENEEKNHLHSKNYSLMKCDISNSQDLENLFMKANFCSEIPTLVFTEFVLAYIETDSIKNLYSWVSQKFHKFSFLDYEMINPHDAFGQTMDKNFRVSNLLRKWDARLWDSHSSILSKSFKKILLPQQKSKM